MCVSRTVFSLAMASRAVGCTLAYALLDVTVTTVLYIHGSHISIIAEEALNFNILWSLLDLWATVLLRSALLLGACIGVWWNRAAGPRRVEKATSAVVLMCLIMVTFAVAKLLLLTEARPVAQQPWALSLLCWTFASSLGILLPWKLLGKVPTATRGSSSSRGGSEDTEKLVNAESEELNPTEEGGEEKQAKSGATLGRLLAYSRKDGGLLSMAVLFLLVSAVCKCDLERIEKRFPPPSRLPEY